MAVLVAASSRCSSSANPAAAKKAKKRRRPKRRSTGRRHRRRTADRAAPAKRSKAPSKARSKPPTPSRDRGDRPPRCPAPPLPAPVTAAYDAGKTVVLLVVHDGGIDDRLVDSWRSSGCGADRRRRRSSSSRPSRSPATRRSPLGARRQPGAGAGRDAAEAAQPRRRRRPASTTASRRRRASSRRSSTPATRAPKLDLPPELSDDELERLQYPSHLQPGPRLRRLGRARRCRARRSSGTPGPDAAAAPRPLARLHHRRPGRARLRRRATVPAGDRGGAHGRARRRRRCCSSRARSTDEQLSRATAERYGLDHVDLAVYQVDMAAATCSRSTLARRYMAVPVGYVDQQHAAGRRRPTRPTCSPSTTSRSPPGSTAASRSPPRSDIEALLGAPQHAAERRQPRRSSRSEDEDERGDARRGQRHAGQRRGRAGDQARLQHPRPGGGGGGLRHPLRARGGRDAGPLPDRRRAAGGRARAEADDRRGDLAAEDHERARHRREAGAAGRPRQRHGRGAPDRPPRHHPADPARRGGDDPHPRRRQRPAHARRPRHGRLGAGAASRTPSAGLRRRAGHRADRLGQVDDPLRGAAGAQRRREEHHHDRGPGRVPDRRASTRSTSTARPGSTSPPACARSCAPTPTSSWSARSATARRRGSRSRRR